MRLFVASLATALIASACSGHPTPPEPLTPEPEDLQPGLVGSDSNQNGIRDDIDSLIQTKFNDRPEIRKAAEQQAHALQRLLVAETKDQALEQARELNRTASCIAQLVPGPENFQRRQDFKELEALTANTRERLVKYAGSNALVAGAYFTQPPSPVCD